MYIVQLIPWDLEVNVWRLCEEADYGTLNCHYTTKVDAR